MVFKFIAMEDEIVLTEELINKGLKGECGCTATQVNVLGDRLRKGWKTRLIGKIIKRVYYELFLELKGVGRIVERNKILHKYGLPPINKKLKAKKRKDGNKPSVNKIEYGKLLKNGNWRKKRREILLRDKFKCKECGSKNDLHIHHLYYYIPKVEPWDYPDDALIALCQICHNSWHRNNKNIYKDFPIN